MNNLLNKLVTFKKQQSVNRLLLRTGALLTGVGTVGLQQTAQILTETYWNHGAL